MAMTVLRIVLVLGGIALAGWMVLIARDLDTRFRRFSKEERRP